MDPNAVAEVARRRHVTLLLQHGSTVKGQVHAGSDLDVAALFEGEHASLTNLLDLTADLQALSPDLRVDAVAINRADPLFLKRILECCRLLYGSPRALAALRMYGYRRYQDHRRYLAMERTYVRKTAERVTAP